MARPRRFTVAGRLLASYLVVLAAFAGTVGWSLGALRTAAREAELLRAGYAPLLVRIGEALADQNVWSAQLNHITSARNPADVREWIDTARRTRAATFASVREAAARGLVGNADPQTARLGDEIVQEVVAIDRSLSTDSERYGQLFQGLAVGDRDAAERVRSELVKRETETAQRLRSLKAHVEERMARLSVDAARREGRSIQFLLSLGALTLLVGVVISLYARRVLRPLSAVTERAKAVARGDLTPRDVVATPDEIGELATTFEGMVAAIQRARAELVHAERLATIGKMAAHVTHEIRNPLSSIGLNLELLEEELAARDVGAEPTTLLAAIQVEVDRLSRIAEQYLSVARRRRPEVERASIGTLVRAVAEFCRPELVRAHVELQIDVADGLPEVRIDESQIRQVLLNLVRNAQEAMPRGGRLLLRAARGGSGIDVDVEDTGEGVAEELRATIFDPFVTTKRRGTGLGLAVSREIVEAHGGTIACLPRSEGGARFRLHFPQAAGET